MTSTGSSSVKPLDDGAEGSLSWFAGDAKRGGVTFTLQGRAAIQNDLNMLEKWVKQECHEVQQTEL